MVRDQWIRMLFIPALGLLIPFFSGVISYAQYSPGGLVLAHLYFVFVSFSIWQGCHWIHGKLRQAKTAKSAPFLKIIFVGLISGLYGISLASVLFLVWIKLSHELFSVSILIRFVALSTFAVILFTLFYEVLYLNQEHELDISRVDQLGKEKTLAELQALRNELDPHFVFNSLTSLSYLIRTDKEKAERFNQKLAQVFRYFLLNKNHDLIPVEKELEFIKTYFYLLQIRHEKKLHLQITGDCPTNGFVVPCSMQLMIENAIKHNAFSEEHPLHILIVLSPEQVCIRNNLRRKTSETPSTNIGLSNLDQRYQLICRRSITVEKSGSEFKVCLPVSHVPVAVTAPGVPKLK